MYVLCTYCTDDTYVCYHPLLLLQFSILAVLCLLVVGTNAVPGGAPDAACPLIRPSPGPNAHGTPQSPLLNPYALTITPWPANGQFMAGATYTVTLSGCGITQTPFRGLLIVAVNVLGNRLGTWTPMDNRTQTMCTVSSFPCVSRNIRYTHTQTLFSFIL